MRGIRFHGAALVNVARLLGTWLDTLPGSQGEVLCGEVGLRIRGELDTALGIDAAYASAELVAGTPGAAIFDGPPVLAVEIVSPMEDPEEIAEKVAIYREIGTIAWVVDTEAPKVTIHRPGSEAVTLGVDEEFSADSYLPGFRARVSEFFE